MRKIFFFFIFIIAINCFSQNRQIAYNFNSVPQSILSNPGSDVDYDWFVGVPLLSGISANVGSSGFSVNDLFANDNVDFNTKLRKVVFSTSRNDKLAINQQLEILSGGFSINKEQKKSYISFGMYQEFDFLAFVPKDFAVLFLDGNRDHLGKVFDFSDLNARADLMTVFHLGFNKKVNKKLNLGARAKIYSSIFNTSSNQNLGYFRTRLGQNNIYEQVISADVAINTSGLTNFINEDSNIEKNVPISNAFLGGNLGLGLDLGLTYYFKPNLQLTASLIDIGFITHKKEIKSYRLKGFYNYNGIEPDFVIENDKDILGRFNDAIVLDTIEAKYKTMRPLKFNTSIQYSFGERRTQDCNCGGNGRINYSNSIGAHLFMLSTTRKPIAALTAYYRKQLFDALEMKATYTIDSFSFKNIGLGLSTQIGKFNFYILGDNLLEYIDVSKANSLSFQLGFNINFSNLAN